MKYNFVWGVTDTSVPLTTILGETKKELPSDMSAKEFARHLVDAARGGAFAGTELSDGTTFVAHNSQRRRDAPAA